MRGLRILQGFVLVCVLLIPVLIFMFLRGFGENHYDLPIFYQNGVDNPFKECNFEDSTQHYIPEFAFTNQEGKTIGRKDMEGKITIVDFFFTSCPSICPVMSKEMERVNDMFRNNPEVQILSISIDPEYDTPEILQEYANEHHATPGKWHFLSGSKLETYELARCGFILPTVDGLGNPDDFIHSDKFTLVDDQGRIRGYYSGTNREDVDLLMLETKVLLHGNK
ncbi:SCO family protein [Algoriphagus zhangzhouensis]|uniref:Protein SCO1/2 n=1 Tax=Algoriphagus zhangzhouensis TaxID=1073327 RepID=A0A1M7ZKE3_9BACT|nr:SCO family protein [Algoriphagus zhangzhouensis]TDY43156.1 protein SCO1/2 [Algoriphagus zhangzhouensis]SHO65289.1 protein SCO1/2 [Algoriphagus zhangzhouensis]